MQDTGIDDWITPGGAQPPAGAPASAGVDDWVTPPPTIGSGASFLRGLTNPVGVAPMIGGAIEGVGRGIGDVLGVNTPAGADGSFSGGFQRGFKDFERKAHLLDAAAADQHPVAYYGGKIASGLAIGAKMPVMIEAAPGAGVGARIAAGTADAAVQGAGYSAVNDFAETPGSLGDRLAAGGEGALNGLVTGAAIGAPLHAVGEGIAALAGRAAAGPSANAVIAASDRQGVRTPAYAASDSLPVQQAGHIIGSLPVIGPKMVEAARTALGDAEQAAGRVSSGFSGGAPATAEQAGLAAKEGINNWIGTTSADLSEAAYRKVDALVDPVTTTPLNATQAEANIIRLERDASARPVDGPATNLIREAVSRPGGLTYDGVKKLRTSIGEMLKNKTSLPSDMSQQELERIYGALSDDLRSAVKNAGRPGAIQAFERANRLHALISARRENLMRLLGAQNDAGVFSAIVNKASSKASSTDTRLLAQARKSMGNDAWNAIASAATDRLGRLNGNGDFSLDRFVTDFRNLSPAGRSVLFAGRRDLASALDDLVTIGSRFKSLNAFKNHSNTAQNLSGIFGLWAFGSHLLAHPYATAAAAIPAVLLSRALSRPATVASMAKWAKVYSNWVVRPSASSLKSLQLVSRQFAGSIGSEFGVTDQIDRMTQGLLGPAGVQVPAAAAAPAQVSNDGSGGPSEGLPGGDGQGDGGNDN